MSEHEFEWVEVDESEARDEWSSVPDFLGGGPAGPIRLLKLPVAFQQWWLHAADYAGAGKAAKLMRAHMFEVAGQLMEHLPLGEIAASEGEEGVCALVEAVWRPDRVAEAARSRGVELSEEGARLSNRETGVALVQLARFFGSVDRRANSLCLANGRTDLKNVHATLLALASMNFHNILASQELASEAFARMDQALYEEDMTTYRAVRMLASACVSRVAHAETEQFLSEGELFKAIESAFAKDPPRHPRMEEARQAAVRRRNLGACVLTVLSGTTVETHERDFKKTCEQYAPLREPMPLSGRHASLELLSVQLLHEFPWMEDTVDQMVSWLAFNRRMGKPWFWLPPLLMVGPPGCGKTRFAHRLGQLAGTSADTISVSGTSDNRMLGGTARGWSSAQPCFPLVSMLRHRLANPLVVLDELDKVGHHDTGNVHQTLLTFTERQSARIYFDECLLQYADLSEVTWIATANDLSPIPDPLLNRFSVVHVDAPDNEHFDAILDSLRRDVAVELNVRVDDLPDLTDAAVKLLAEAFRKGVSIRRIRAAFMRAITVSNDSGNGPLMH